MKKLTEITCWILLVLGGLWSIGYGLRDLGHGTTFQLSGLSVSAGSNHINDYDVDLTQDSGARVYLDGSYEEPYLLFMHGNAVERVETDICYQTVEGKHMIQKSYSDDKVTLKAMPCE